MKSVLHIKCYQCSFLFHSISYLNYKIISSSFIRDISFLYDAVSHKCKDRKESPDTVAKVIKIPNSIEKQIRGMEIIEKGGDLQELEDDNIETVSTVIVDCIHQEPVVRSPNKHYSHWTYLIHRIKIYPDAVILLH
jgi:hypothetical protein